ncbi:unnamed protein product, partial [Ixodes hexagonus]
REEGGWPAARGVAFRPRGVEEKHSRAQGAARIPDARSADGARTGGSGFGRGVRQGQGEPGSPPRNSSRRVARSPGPGSSSSSSPRCHFVGAPRCLRSARGVGGGGTFWRSFSPKALVAAGGGMSEVCRVTRHRSRDRFARPPPALPAPVMRRP